jgi:hypothetical protein
VSENSQVEAGELVAGVEGWKGGERQRGMKRKRDGEFRVGGQRRQAWVLGTGWCLGLPKEVKVLRCWH